MPTEKPPNPPPPPRVQSVDLVESGGLAVSVTDAEVMAMAEKMGITGRQISSHELCEIRKRLAGEAPTKTYYERCVESGAVMSKRRWFVPS
jgi:hypothetical protein